MRVVPMPGRVAENGLNVRSRRERALRGGADSPALIADVLGQRLALTPPAVLAIVLFALAAGYPPRMVAGAALAGTGMLIMALASALLVRLTVELRNAGLAFVDFFRQLVTLAGVAVLVAAGAHLTPLLAV